MADVMENINLDEFEKEANAQTAVIQKPETLLTSNEDEEGFAGLFADWDITPQDILV